MFSMIFLINMGVAEEIVFVPSITDQPVLSNGLQEALSIRSKGRNRYILTKQNLKIYTQENNIQMYMVTSKQTELEQAKELKAKHLVLSSYTQEKNLHRLKAVVYRSDLNAMQASISIQASSISALQQKIPAFGEQIISYTLIEEGVRDPLAYPMMDLPSGAYFSDGKRINLSGFQMGKFEVSQILYMAIMDENPSRREDCDAPSAIKTLNTPVSCVSVFDAARFANAYSKRHGKEACYEIFRDQIQSKPACNGFRLPTSKEWFYAASFGEKKRYSGSDDARLVAWTEENSQEMLHPIGTLSSNAASIHDLSGNVAEWTETSENTEYIVRGGSYQQPQERADISLVERLSPELLLDDQGFRLVIKK